MIIDRLLFDEFLNENRDKLDYPVKSYPINEENFARWVLNHSEPYRQAAINFRLKTRHVSFTEFKETIGKVVVDIVRYIYETNPENIILYIDERLTKSNFFVSLYMYSLLSNYKFNQPIKIITYISDIKLFGETSLLILPDDATYSGQQISEELLTNIIGTPHPIFIAIPYISSFSYEYIKGWRLNLIFSEKSEIFEPLGGSHTIYFDHKLADSASIYTDVYSIGQEASYIRDPDFTYEEMSLITGCNRSKDTFYMSDPKFECPPPFYKFLTYTYRGLPIESANQIGRQAPPQPVFRSDVSFLPQSHSFLPPSFSLLPPSFSLLPPNFSGQRSRSKRRSHSKRRSRSKKNVFRR